MTCPRKEKIDPKERTNQKATKAQNQKYKNYVDTKAT